MSQGSSQSLQSARIEFRAWTGKKMICQDSQYLGSFIRRVVLQINLDHGGTEYGEYESYLPNGGTIDEYLQQYIRLNDKNDKKAYIGDIVRVDIPFHIDDTRIYQITERDILGFCLLQDGDEYDGMNLEIIPFEVIGNCKEHPELLSAKDGEVQA